MLRIFNKFNTKLDSSAKIFNFVNNYRKPMQELKPLHPLPSRPVNMNDAQFTQVVESKDDFQYVRKILPTLIVPEPPKHDQYPTPSGWVPIDVKKASKLPYYVLRTRFHNYPIYLTEREGGSRKLIRIRYIEGDIWKFDQDLRSFIKEMVAQNEGKNLEIYSQVNELQRQVLVKGLYQEPNLRYFDSLI